MFGLKSGDQTARVSFRRVRATRRWVERHPRRYRDVQPVVICPACHGATVLTPDLDERLWAGPVPCPRCEQGMITRAPSDRQGTDGMSA
jgi:hypothetical protein